jgi:WD40 repeat protein
MLVSALDSTMLLVGTEQGEVARVYRGHTNKLYCSMNTFVVTLPDEQQAVACGSEDGSIWLWDLNSKQVRGVFNTVSVAHSHQ